MSKRKSKSKNAVAMLFGVLALLFFAIIIIALLFTPAAPFVFGAVILPWILAVDKQNEAKKLAALKAELLGTAGPSKS